MDPSSITASDPVGDVDVLDGAVQLGDLAAALYGPDGRHKLVVTDEPVVAGDLQQLFDALDVEHPGAAMVGTGAVQQKERLGDGSTAIVLLAGALAERAEDLLADGLHRATVADGYDRARAAAETAIPSISTPVDGLDDPRGRAAVRAALGSYDDDETVDAVVEAARLVAEARETGREGRGVEHVDFRHVADAHAPRAELVHGTFLEREPVTPNTPRDFEDARVAVVAGGKNAGRGIEEKELKRAGGSEGKGRTEVTLQPETPTERTAFQQREIEEVAAQVQALSDADVDVVFTAMGISDRAISALDEAGITAFRGLQASQARLVSRTTGASLVMDIADVSRADVGTAGRLQVETDPDGGQYVRIDRCPDGEIATLLVAGTVRAGTDAVQRDLMTGVVTGRTILEGGEVVPGGGGAWTRLAAAVRDEARSVPDRSAVVMDAFADALEDLPRTLARNAGGDPLDALTGLRAGGPDAVYDGDARTVRAAGERGPYDLAAVVEGAVATAADVTAQLVRVDDVLRARDEDDDEPDDYDFSPDPERDVA